MRAVMCRAWGTPADLVVEDVEGLPPAEGELRVGVHACGVNFADTLMIAGKYQDRPSLPFTPGVEVAGEVLECGAGVTHVAPGARVVAFCSLGGYAEQVTVPAAQVTPIPNQMDYVSAAAFQITYGTSHIALTRRARLRSGEVLLVHGAAGGVGLTAVEIGKHLGATVIATVSSPQKLRLAAEYGADHLIDYTQADFRERVMELTGGAGADVVFDPVGGDVFDQSLRCLNWEGRLLVIGFASGRIPQAPANHVLLKNYAVVGMYWGAYAQRDPQVMRDSLAELLRWYEQGALRPHVSQTYPLERTVDALSALLKRESTGKVVLTTQRSA